MWKDSEGYDRTNWNRFGDAKADLDSFLESPFYHDKGQIKSCNLMNLHVSCFSIFYFQACVSTFWTICTTFTSFLNSCEYSYVGDGVGIMLGSWESAVGSYFTAPPLYRFVMLTRIYYTSITCQMEIKNNCFYTLHCIVYMSVNTATFI